MTATFKRGEIRNRESFDRAIWDWSILEGCFGDSRISPTDIDGCVERKGHKLFLETKRPGAPMPYGQKLFLRSLVDDGHTVLIVWGEDDVPQSMKLITPFKQIEYKSTTLETLRQVVSQWFTWADGNEIDNSDPANTARAFWRRKGRDYCDTMMAEWAKLDELDKLPKAQL